MEIDIAPSAPPPTADASPVEADLPPEDAAPPVAEGEGPTSAVEETEGAEKAKDEKAEPEKETPKESAIARSLRKREAQIVQRQQEQARGHEELQAKVRGFNDHISKVEVEVKAFRQEQAEAKANPVAFLEKATGQKFEDFLRTWMNDGKVPIEQVVDQKTSALEKKLADFERREKEREDKAREQAESHHAAQENAAINQQIVSLGSNASRFPTLAALYKGSEADLIAEVRRASEASSKAVQERTRTPQNPQGQVVRYTPEQVLTHLEKQHAERYKKLAPPPSLGAPVTESAVQSATKSAEKPGHKEPLANGKTAPTLNGKGASQRASMPKDDPLLLSKEEENRRVLEAIEAVKRGQQQARSA